jgi:hypothetical protein
VDQAINAGAITVGSAAAAGTMTAQLLPNTDSTTQPSFTNDGAITIQNGSSFALSPTALTVPKRIFLNAAGAPLAIESGGSFSFTDGFGFGPGTGSLRNDGAILVSGAGSTFNFAGVYSGGGVLDVAGQAGATTPSTVATIDGPASGVFNISNGEMYFADTSADPSGNPPVSGTVNFLDNNSILRIDTGLITPSVGAKDDPFGATITGFRAGDIIDISQSLAVFPTPSYDPATNILTVFGENPDGSEAGPVAQLKILGNYASGDFTLTSAPTFFGQFQDQGAFTITTDVVAPGIGGTDILLQNTDGQVAIWEMNGTNMIAHAPVADPGPSWRAIGTADFNGDGKSDILLQNTDGRVAIWEMNGTNLIGGAVESNNPGPSWRAIGTGDFNDDGHSDILWQNTDGRVAIWEMNGTNVIGGAVESINPGPSWHAIGTGDFNGDGHADILWQNTDGRVAIWEMNGTNVVGGGLVAPNPAPDWRAI